MATIEERPIGYGRHKRKEDPRFIRGQGTYVDDVNLPGMLHGAVLRSPLAHARIVSIDTSAALAHPKVRAVITGKDLEGLGLAWMPTMSYDTQAVLATDKVRFQGQEVAFVVATDRYVARDALELIEVDYEELPVVVNARKALDPGAPVIRDDKDGQTDNHIFDWEAGEVLAGHDGAHPRVRHRGRRVDGDDPRVGDGAAQDRAVQHPGQHHVVDVGALAADEARVLLALEAAVAGDRGLFLLLGGRHALSPPRSARRRCDPRPSAPP